MYAVLKHTLIASAAAGLLSVITLSGNKTSYPMSEKQISNVRNPFILAVDTPPVEPVTNEDLPFPIKENQPGEPVYNANQPLQLNNPSNVKTSLNYNPSDSTFNFTQKMGNLDYRPPIYMTQEEYQDYLFKNQVKSYWKSRIQADAKSNPAKTSLIPKLTVNSELFDRLFGGSTVDIRPTGSAELIFGFITNRNQNPAIPVKQRKITNFDFNMKIQLNLVGKIGEKLKLTTNYNTEASFDFENQMKLEYNGLEDEIIKKVEAGNVSLPLNNSLITGSQTLFGIKTTMQFGKLSVVALASQQRGKKTELTVQGGSQTIPFNVTADNYEANRHYFLGQYFRDNYNSWINVPIVSSPIQITKIEVYVTNRTNQVDQARNIAAFADLGEDTSHIFYNNTHNTSAYNIIDSTDFTLIPPRGRPNPRNSSNSLYKALVDTGNGLLKNRDYNTAVKSLTDVLDMSSHQVFNAGREFEVLTRARRLNPQTDYTLNNRLGYISLNTSLNYDEVLSVAYQYTINGQVYQVGEFSDQFPTGDKLLVLKMLKSTQLNTHIPMWDLMMKNVYSIGAYSLSQTNFQLSVIYNNLKTGVDIPYIPYGDLNGKLLIQVMNLDQINQNQDKFSDGYFDFVPNITVNTQNGRIYFTQVEPFGSDLAKAFGTDASLPAVKDAYIFQELYDSTRVAAQQLPQKNRYKLKGSYQSATSNEFSLNSMNIPQGSVRVTAGGVPLSENVDYTVDYTLGRVKIINESILNSGQPIKISAENNSLFNIQQKSLIGTRLDYKVNKDFSIGSTLLHMTERPLTQKVNIGDEPVSNSVVGLDYTYRHDAPWLTRFVDKIPLINTKEASSIQLAGEFAKLIPGHSKAIGKSGNSYVDDFEGSVSVIDLRGQSAWAHSSIPQGQSNLFPEATLDSVRSGYNRAKLAWYTIDQSIFYQQTSGLTPPQVTKTVQSNHYMEAFFESDLFPKKTPPNGQPQLLPMLDLAYYPNERGPYNFDVTPYGPAHSHGVDITKSNTEGKIILARPETRWAGITRRLETNDFQSANIEYIQFWMMDPFNEDYNNQTQSQYNTFHVAPPTTGELYINLGSVSEDILKDGNMAYENGMAAANDPQFESKDPKCVWGRYPSTPPLVNAFDNVDAARVYQDVGYDGLGNGDEQSYFNNYLQALNGVGVTGGKAFSDPTGDDYHFYRGDDYDQNSAANTLFRYKEYNGVEGNSPTQTQYAHQNGGGYSTVASTTPNIEDVNRDNTMNQSEAYYQYKLKITPQDINVNNIGNNYIVNVIPVQKAGPDGVPRTVNFYQFKIPVAAFDNKIGTIEGFNSIRFMRMFVKNFTEPVIMRFARLELVRSDWRNYQQDLADPANGIIVDASASFDVSAVSYQENGTRTPINYVLPPQINQQQNVQTTNLVLLNEQALSMRVCGLKDGDRRAIYKNVNYDVRSYKKLKMFVHGEKLNNQPLNNGDVHVFVRLGSDFTNNYYEYELPLNLTAPGNYDNNSDGDRAKVWLESNNVEIDFAELTSSKLKRNEDHTWPLTKPYPVNIADGRIVRVVGNPNIAALTNIMVGIYNPITQSDPSDKCAEVWINELRLTDFDQKGGWAANSRVTAKLADFGQVSVSGAVATPFYGSIEKKPSERSRDLTLQYDASTTLQLGKFFPKDWKLNVPMYLGYSEIIITPQYDPNNPDVLMSSVNADNGFTNSQISQIKSRAQDYTRRRGINFTNVSKQKGKNKTKAFPWDIENFSVTYAFTEQFKHNLSTAWSFNKNYNGGLNYNYQQTIKPIEPFKNSKAKILENPWFALIKETNFTPLPSQFNFSTNVTRNYIEILSRDITNPTDNFTKPQFNKTFNVSRVYAVRWDITKNIKADLNANNDGRVLEPYAQYGPGDREKVQNRLLTGGLTTAYRQTSNLNVNIPLNKIPILDFVTSATYKYTTSYQWQRKPFAQPEVGNTINNNQQQTINTSFNMTTLYNKIPYFKRVNLGINNKKEDAPAKPKDPKDPKNPKGVKKPDDKDTTKPKDPPQIFEYVARLIMTLKQASFTFNQTQGTTLPGFQDSTSFLGMDGRSHNGAVPTFAPGPGFVFGQQNKILDDVLDPKKNLLVQRNNFSSPYAHTFLRTYSFQAKVEPFKNFKIDLTGTRTYGQNDGFFIGWDSLNSKYRKITPTQTGNFSISVITIRTAFSKDDKITHASTVFDNFMNIRGDYATLLSKQSINKGLSNTLGDGYNKNQQDVVVLAFLDSYTGKKSKKLESASLFPAIPMPNWSLTYDGLGKLDFLKPIFKSVIVSHAYRSTMSIGGFTNNQAFIGDGFYGSSRVDQTNANSNFVSKYVINTVSLSEQFAPLVKFNMNFVDKGKLKGLGANVELKRDRTTTLSANIPQVMEMRGNELNIGSTYTFPNLTINRIKIQNKPLKSDLQMSLTFSVRQNQTTIHKINTDVVTNQEYQFSQLTNGTNIISIKTSFTYVISQNINLRFFYDRTINRPVISTSFPTQTTNAGVSLRFVIQ